jgi:hypothetical protein
MKKLLGLLMVSAACVLTILAAAPVLPQAPLSARHVNSQRLQQTLEKLSEFGRNPEGGVTRLGFSDEDLAARSG